MPEFEIAMKWVRADSYSFYHVDKTREYESVSEIGGGGEKPLTALKDFLEQRELGSAEGVLIAPRSGSQITIYDPTKSSVHVDLMNLDPNKIEDVFSFVEDYGLLGTGLRWDKIWSSEEFHAHTPTKVSELKIIPKNLTLLKEQPLTNELIFKEGHEFFDPVLLQNPAEVEQKGWNAPDKDYFDLAKEFDHWDKYGESIVGAIDGLEIQTRITNRPSQTITKAINYFEKKYPTSLNGSSGEYPSPVTGRGLQTVPDISDRGVTLAIKPMSLWDYCGLKLFEPGTECILCGKYTQNSPNDITCRDDAGKFRQRRSQQTKNFLKWLGEEKDKSSMVDNWNTRQANNNSLARYHPAERLPSWPTFDHEQTEPLNEEELSLAKEWVEKKLQHNRSDPDDPLKKIILETEVDDL